MNKIFFIVFLLIPYAWGSELTEVRLYTKDQKSFIDFKFIPEESLIPRFFQTYKSNSQKYSINFLESFSEIQLGEYKVPNDFLGVEKVTIKIIQKKNGPDIRNFLKVGFDPIELIGEEKLKAFKSTNGILSLLIGPYSGPDNEWWITHSTPPSIEEQSQVSNQKLQNIIEQESENIPLDDPTESEEEDEELEQEKLKPQIEDQKAAAGLPPEQNQMAVESKKIAEKVIVPPAKPGKQGKITLPPIELVILRDNINVRDKPSTSGNIIGQIPIGNKVKQMKKLKDWMEVNWNSQTGYIWHKLVVESNKITEEQKFQIKKVQLKKESQTKTKDQMARIKQMESESKKKYEKELAAIKEKYDQELMKFNEKNIGKSKNDSITREMVIDKIKTDLEKIKSSKKDSLDGMLKSLELKQDKEAKKIRQHYLDSVNQLVKSSDKEINQLKNDHQKELKSMKSELKELLRKNKKNYELKKKQTLLELRTRKGRVAAEIRKKAKTVHSFRHRYRSHSRRDPFVPLTTEIVGDLSIRVDRMRLVGIISSDESEPIAILEDRIEPSLSATLKKGDKVYQGRVLQISSDRVAFEIYDSAGTHIYTLRLETPQQGRTDD